MESDKARHLASQQYQKFWKHFNQSVAWGRASIFSVMIFMNFKITRKIDDMLPTTYYQDYFIRAFNICIFVPFLSGRP
jgi:hypothetical protein